jgi:hypothetical protein
MLFYLLNALGHITSTNKPMAFCNCHGLVSLEDCSRLSYQQIPKATDTGFDVAAIHDNGNALPGTE